MDEKDILRLIEDHAKRITELERQAIRLGEGQGKVSESLRKPTDEELRLIKQKVKEKIDEREGRGNFGLWACVDSVISYLIVSEVDICEVRRQFLNAKEKQGHFFNSLTFKALNLIEAEIYNLKY